MKSLTAAVAAVSMAVAAPAFAEKWDIDPSHSQASFTARHMMIANVDGTFKGVKGTVNLDPKDITKSTVEASVDARTVNTNDEKRDAHLKSEEFFATEKFPNLTFKSTKVAKAGKNKLKVTGDLTMRGVTKPVTFDVETTDTAVDPWGNTRMGVQATTKVDRTQWGINWNQTLDKGGVLVGNEVKLTLNAELIKAKEAAPSTAGSK